MSELSQDLIEKITKTFNRSVENNNVIKRISTKIEKGTATIADADRYAEEIGRSLSYALNLWLNGSTLPDGRLYYNIANDVMRAVLGDDYDKIASTTDKIFKIVNDNAGVGLKVVTPELNTDRVEGLIDALSDAEQFDDVKYLTQEPIINFSQAIVDDFVHDNAKLANEAGLKPTITRRVMASCCPWCEALAGTYDYEDAPDDIYKRHERCRCVVEYHPTGGRDKQNVWTKRWS